MTVTETPQQPLDYRPANLRTTWVHENEDYANLVMSSYPRGSIAEVVRNTQGRFDLYWFGFGTTAVGIKLPEPGFYTIKGAKGYAEQLVGRAVVAW